MSLLVSIVIPVYQEQGYLLDCLYRLAHQSIIHKCEVILSDYDPENTGGTSQAIAQMGEYPCPLNIVNVRKRGIGYARQVGCDQSSSEAPIICDMDADAYYSTNDGLEKMIKPILEGNGHVVMTACDNYVDGGQEAQLFYNPLKGFFNAAQAILPVLTRYEPGSCVLKSALYEAGGFDDTRESEMRGMIMHFSLNYPFGSIVNVRDTHVIKSSRRDKAVLSFDLNQIIQASDHYYAFR